MNSETRQIVLSKIIFALITLAAVPMFADDWADWRGAGREGVWNESGIVSKFDSSSLEVVWKQNISSGYSGPTVADGLVYVMDRKTGDETPRDADRAPGPKQTERVLCFDAATGAPVWQHEYYAKYVNVGYVAGPRASVTIDGPLVYSIGTMGHMNCLDAKTGKVVWARDLDAEYKISESKRMPIWGISASPLIYDDKVILHIGGPEGACLVALDKQTGKEQWRALDDRAQYSSPILHKQNGKDVVICWTGDSVAGLDPTSGLVHWRHPFLPKNMPIGIATPIVQGNRIFVTSFYDGALMLEMDSDAMTVSEVWKFCGENERSTKVLHSIISTPVWIGDHIYGVDSYGEFRCIKAADGTRVWEDLTAVPKSRWSTIHFVQNGNDTWMFNERGELILSRLSPDGFKELSRAKLIEPTKLQLRQRNGVCWSHPAFANQCVFVRNDNEIRCISLSANE